MFGWLKKLFGSGKTVETKKIEIQTAVKTDTVNLQGSTSQLLDCKNLNCPMPIINISQVIKTMKPGEQLIVEATDPAFKADVEAWVRKTGMELVSFVDGEVKVATIKKI